MRGCCAVVGAPCIGWSRILCSGRCVWREYCRAPVCSNVPGWTHILNPSFEDNPSVGTPAGCYANVGEGRGATYFVDSRLAVHGTHSLRIHVPAEGAACGLGFFPLALVKDRPVRLSVWAKGQPLPPVPGQSAEAAPVQCSLRLGDLNGDGTFTVTPEWTEYAFELTPDKDYPRISPALTVHTPGTVWFDLLQLVSE